ncbi:MAG: hypothetical protein ABEH88_01920 [Halobacteriales archaeon]
MSSSSDYQDVRERIRRERQRHERERREKWEFPPDEFVRASELVEERW